MPKKWVIEFNQVEIYEVEVEADSDTQAEKIATKLIREDCNPYFMCNEGLECVNVCEIEV